MNIAFDIGGIPGFRGGGIEHVIIQLFQTMSRKFPEDQFYIFDLFGEYAFAENVKTENVHHCYYFSGKDGILRRYRGKFQDLLGALVRNFTKENQIDVFYVPAPFLATPDIGQNAVYQPQWFENTAVVAQLHDIIPYLMREIYLPTKQEYKRYMDCAQILHWADRVLAISNSAKDDAVSALGLEREKIGLAYHGHSDEFHKIDVTEKEKAALYAQLGITEPFLMCSASADERKNVAAAVEAFTMLPERIRSKYQMVVVGRVGDDAQARCQKLIRKKRLVDRVCFTGFVTKEQLVQLYNLAELLIFPSLYEGFGIPVLEAWACGTAVAASNNSGLGEVVGQAGLTFDPKDPADIARTLEYAVTSADLDAFARQGEERLEQFTWDRAADAAMETFRRASSERLDTLAKKKEKLLCAFLTDAPLPPSWKAVLSKLAEQTDLTVAVRRKEEDWNPEFELMDWKDLRYYDPGIDMETVYIAPEQICADAFALIKQNPGKWLVMDQDLDELILWISGLTGDGLSEIYGQAEKLRHYFDQNEMEQFREPDFLPYLTGVIAAGPKKRTELSEHILNLPVYDICPGVKRGQGTKGENSTAVGYAFENLKNAMCERQLISDRARMFSLCEQELREKNYNPVELRAFSKTVGAAFGTEASMRRLVRKTSGGKPKVAMITSWNMKCGIAEYTKYYIEASEEKVEYQIYPSRTEKLLGPEDEKTRERIWESMGSLDQLIDVLSRSSEDIVHFQHTSSYFKYEEICKLAERLPKNKKIVMTCHNPSYIHIRNSHECELLSRICFVVHQEQDRDHLTQQGLPYEQVRLIPLGQKTAPKRETEVARTALGIAAASPVIGSYGFFLRHKGIANTIRAVATLKKIWPNILYIPCCSFHNLEADSIPYYQECVETVHSLGLEENVRFITDFLKPEESILILQSCDALVCAYDPTMESASGAVRFCMAARRPVITTAEPIFREVSDCTIQIPDNTPAEIAGALEQLLRQGADVRIMDALERRLEETAWPVISERYFTLYKD